MGFPANHVGLAWNRPACQPECLCVAVATNPTHAPVPREIHTNNPSFDSEVVFSSALRG
jgi:hypothetical protein